MKKSLIAAWMLIAVVFALGLMGLAGRSILPNTQKEKITVPDPGVSDSSVSIRVKIGDTVQKNEPGQLCTGRAPGRDARFL